MSSISISFDPSHNPEMPTMVLMKKSGEMFGQLDAKSVVIKDKFVNAPEITFVVKKYVDGEVTPLWDKITNFKLIYCVEWNTVFEIKIDVDETNEITKTVYGTELAQSELSQIVLFNNEFNTETDIAREDYINPTVLYKPNTPSESLLNRMLEKAPHYNILHVDDSIKNIQKTFSFNNVSLFDAFNQVAEEIDCVFVYNSKLNSNGDIIRGISVYDLETVCNNCGHRGDYIDTCPKCNSTNLTNGYGDDTTIFITADKLASDIQLSTDVGAVKNCFKLEAGDDLMTATIRNCNPDGSGYIWYISNKLKEDMSDELIEKLDNYNVFYDYYQNSYNPFAIDTSGLNNTDAAKVHSQLASNSSLITSYNNLISKYSTYTSDYHAISSSIIGYSELMKIYYDTISFYYYLNDSLMPTVTMSETNAQTEANKLNNQNLKNTAVQNLSSTTSVATVSSALLAMAKVLVDTNYQIKIVDEESTFTYSQSQSKWKGKFVVTNYSDESDTYTTAFQTIDISSDYTTFIKQKLDVALAKTKTDTIASINDLFSLNDTNFKKELKKYSLQRLKSFHDACQSCLDILQQQGIANDRNEDNDEPTSMYSTIYLPYYNKLGFIQSEMDIRQSELYIVQGKFDENGGILEQGMQTILQNEQNTIQDNLDFQEYLGENLWLELLTYRREDMYSNDNYISDGLDNAELFDKATEFIQTAKTEIKKSATLQHTITATLKNLLVMKEFNPIVDYFKVGNWLRIQIDDVIYKLRLVDYEIDFDNLENINITFSDVTVDNSGTSSIKDVLSQASNMATTYNTVSRQAKKGNESANALDNWVDNGLMTTKTKIVNSADNQDIIWDKHGLLCREYDSVSDSYGDKQLKLINKGLYLTDNNWRTAKAGIGNFTFFNPAANNGEGEWQEAYGVIADTIVGNIILGKGVGIYNIKNSITMDEDGFVLTTNGTNNNETQSVFTIRRKTIDNGISSFKDMFYIDSNGFVTINGGIKIDIDGENSNSTIVEMVDGKITTHITDELADGGLIESSISQTASQIQSTVSATYETKSDAETKKANLESTISQTASQIQSTVSAAVSKWDVSELNYNIDVYGYGHPQTDNGLLPVNYPNKYYLDQTNGYVYYAPNGSVWSKVTELTLITSNLSSQITQIADSILSTVSSTYETKTDSNNKKTALESSINQTASNIASTVKTTSGWDIASLDYTISIIGTVDRGDDHSSIDGYAAEDYIGKFYLNDLTGHVYESKLESDGSGYVWWWKANLTRVDSSIYSRIDQTADQIKLNISSSLSQYDLSSFSGVISVFGYGVPTASNPSASTYKNQYYLNQSNGQVYKSNGSSWSTYGNPLSVINGSWQSQITANANAITSKVGSADVHTIIQQTPEDVRIAWNGISNYISFENSAIKIKDSNNNLLMQLSNSGLNLYNNSSALLMNLNNNGMNLYDSNNTLLMRLNSSGIGLYESDGSSGNRLTMRMNRNGANYYNEGNFVGSIGTNKMAGDATIRGLTFNLETVADGDTARYMSWGYRDNGDNVYTVKMAYYTNDFSYTNSSSIQQNWKKGFHFADDVYFRYDAHIGNNGYIGYYNDGIILENTVDNSTNSFLRFTGGRGATVKLDEDINISADTGKLSSYVDFYMNNHIIYDSVISSSSDARLKKNISSSSEMALSLLNKIDISQFDWIETDEHIAAGFIAQQLQEVIPQTVLENPETTRLSIRTEMLIPYIVKAIQELTECIENDNKYKGTLQSIGVTTLKNKKKWEDKTSLSDKKRFISETKIKPPIIEKPSEKERKNKRIILIG